MKNLSDQFKPSSTFFDSDSSEEKDSDKARLFELSELLERVSERHGDFSFDSETARNFDQENVKKAKQGVKEMMADAIAKVKMQAVEIRDSAYKEGYKAGHDEGYQTAFQKGENSAKEEFSPLLETLSNLIQELSEFRTMMYPKVEKEMIGMVVALTKKVLQHEISLKEDSVKQMIHLAMNSVIDKENMVIRIHPSDKGHAEAFGPELQRMFGEIKNITFEEHPEIERGGCVIDTNFGTVDAQVNQLEEQIDKILKLTPTVPEVKSDSKTLPKKIPDTETEVTDESTGSDPTSEAETEAASGSTDSETPTSEAETKAASGSTDSETPTSDKLSEGIPEKED